MATYWLGYILLVAASILFLTFLLRFLWNITMPDVFNLNYLHFWQAFRLIIISCILFGGPILILK